MAAGTNVDMQRLARVALVGVEEESETLVAEHHRHRLILSKCLRACGGVALAINGMSTPANQEQP